MKVNSANPYLFTANVRERTGRGESDNFANALLNRMGGAKDSYVEAERKSDYLCENYSDLFLNAANKSSYTGSIKTVETERYKIVERESGVVRIYDKEQNNEAIDLKLNKDRVQVDKETGTKFIINDYGAGFFIMMAVDDELEAGLKEVLGVDELEEKELTGFTVHTDQKTGIKYVTANGYESRGGYLVLDNETKQKLDSMAKEFLEQYPNLAKTYNEAWFYATFEVRGLLKRTPNEGRGVYWEIPICASAFLGEEVVVIQKIKCPNHECGRRIFDIGITRFRIIVELKCPHCGEVVRVYWKPKEKKKYT